MSALPVPSPAMQKVSEGQDTYSNPRSYALGSTGSGFDHEEPSKVMAFPLASTAMQKEAEGHEMEPGTLLGSISTGSDHEEPL